MGPWQSGLALEAMNTLVGTVGLSKATRGFDAAGLPVPHEKLDWRMHVTKSPFVGGYINTGWLDPMSIPLTLHWKTGLSPPLTGVAV